MYIYVCVCVCVCIYIYSFLPVCDMLFNFFNSLSKNRILILMKSNFCKCFMVGACMCSSIEIFANPKWFLSEVTFTPLPCAHSPRRGLQQCLEIFFFFLIFIYLFMAVLGLRFCARAFSSCGKRGPLFIAVRGPLTIAASLVVEHRLQTRRLSSCGSRAQPLRGMWDLPRPGLEPVSPALAGRVSTTAPPRKPLEIFLMVTTGRELLVSSD